MFQEFKVLKGFKGLWFRVAELRAFKGRAGFRL